MKSITNILLKSQIQKDTANRKKQFLSWDAIQKIAIIIDNQTSVNKSVIDKFCADSKKFIEIFCIELNAKQPSFGDWQCFTAKQKTVFKLPKQTTLINLKNKQFDCVINTCSAQNLFAVSVQSGLQAPLKCSDNNDFNQSDLIILKSQTFTVIDYLNDTIRYLKMIK